VLPEQTRDDTDEGWGDDRGGADVGPAGGPDGTWSRGDDWYERERPPHWE